MVEYRTSSHTVSSLSAHLVWVTKYRYHVLPGEFPALRKQYWDRRFWAVGYGAWNTGNITDEIVQLYLSHHQHKPNSKSDDWILE